MIEFLQTHLTTILGGTAFGAFIGGIVGLMASAGSGKKLNSAMVSEARTLIGALGTVREGMGATRNGFGAILAMLTPDLPAAAQDDGPVDILPETMAMPVDQADGQIGADLAPAAAPDHGEGNNLPARILAGVLAIPALPQLPGFTRNFEILRNNKTFAPVLDQLSRLDIDGLNTMLDEFKSLVETSLQPGLEQGAGGGFTLEPETVETLTRSVGEFSKAITTMEEVVGGVVDKITDLVSGR